jgi:hypothetical protein
MRPSSSSSSVFSFLSKDVQLRVRTDRWKDDDNESINIMSTEDDDASNIRQSAPMVLSLEQIAESTPEVLEMEMERMTLDEIQEIGKSIGGNI